MTLRFDLATAQFSDYSPTGFIGVQIDGMGEDAGLPPWELHHPFGFSSRPRDPSPTGLGCNTLVADEGDSRGHCWLAADPRAVPLLPKVAKGGSVQYAWTGALITYALFDGDTGNYLLKVGTQEIAVGIDGTLSLSAMGGLAKVDVSPTGVTVTSAATSVGVTPTGVDVLAPVVNVTAATAANVTAPAVALTGNVAITGNLAVTGSSTVAGHVVLVA